MTTVIDVIYSDFRDAGAILMRNDEASLRIMLDGITRKTLLLSAASYFETQLTKIVLDYAREVTSGNPLVVSLVQSKAYSVNIILGLIGKEQMQTDSFRYLATNFANICYRVLPEISSWRNQSAHLWKLEVYVILLCIQITRAS